MTTCTMDTARSRARRIGETRVRIQETLARWGGWLTARVAAIGKRLTCTFTFTWTRNEDGDSWEVHESWRIRATSRNGEALRSNRET